MKLKLGTIETSSSTDFQTTAFDIGNKAVIMDILRGKMYSNPIKIICQEIMCNARDAHREVGKYDVPIQIKFPTMIDPTFVIRDFGPGITPQRMAEIFVMYGESTKRNSNEQTGGFGLGSKTPFSYSDTFSVVSITPDEDGVLVQREYVAYIDDSRLGAMSMVNETIATEPQGTSIIITVKQEDFYAFRENVELTARHWDVKPVDATGKKIPWQNIEIAQSGNGWFIMKGQENRQEEQRAIVDGIEYRLNFDNIFPKNDQQGLPEDKSLYLSCKRLGFCLIFKTGEIEVTATREDLDYKEKTRKRVLRSIETIRNELSQSIAAEIAKQTSLRKAVIQYSTSISKWDAFTDKKTTWNGIELEPIRGRGIKMFRMVEKDGKPVKEAIGLDVKLVQNHVYYSNIHGIDINTVRIYDRRIDFLPAYKSTIICEDDTNSKNVKRRAITLLNSEIEGDEAYIVKFTNKEEEKYIKENFHWDLLDVVKLSSFEPAEIKTKRGVVGVVAKVKTISGSEWMPAKECDYKDLKIKYYVLLKGEMATIDDTITGGEGYNVSASDVSQLRKIFNIFGVFTRLEKHLDETWIRISRSFLEGVLPIVENQDILQHYFKYGDNWGVFRNITRNRGFNPKDLEGLADDSLFREIAIASVKYDFFEVKKSVDGYKRLCKMVGKTLKEHQDIMNDLHREYPLLKNIHDAKKEEIIVYIKAKDDQKQAQKAIEQGDLKDEVCQPHQNT